MDGGDKGKKDMYRAFVILVPSETSRIHTMRDAFRLWICI